MTAPSVVPGRGTPERELDALIAEKVFGWLWLYRFGQRWFGPPSVVGEHDRIYGTVRAWDEAAFPEAEVEDGWWLRDVAGSSDSPVVPHYSTDIAVAWQVVEKMRANGHTFGVDYIGEEHDDRPWMAWFFAPFDARDCDDRRYTEWAATAPLAICLAALMAVGASRRDPALAVDRSWSSPDAAAVAPTSSVPSRDAGGADR